MTSSLQVPRGTPRVQYVADGHQTAYPFPFPIFASEDLAVHLGAALQSTGFTVSGSGVTAGGTATFATAPAAGTIVTLTRRVPIERVTDFQESGPLSALALNTELDVLTACLQQVAGDQQAMLHYADTDLPAAAELPGRTVRSGQLLGFDGSGNPTVVPPVNTQALSTYLPQGAGAVARPIGDKLGDSVSAKDFGAIGDGVTDEFRQLSPGVIIGKSFYGGPQGWLPETWRRQRDTNYFMLFQVRAPACGACGNACLSWC